MIGPDYDHFCRLVLARSGLVLGADKAYLVQSRLEPVARRHGVASATALLATLRAGASDALITACVDAMATHESLFFRDGSPFDQLANVVLPELSRNREPGVPIRIWCAACSSGQEPYSIAMLVSEQAVRFAGRRIGIVGTDMAAAIVDRARAGVFSDFEVRRGLSPERRDRWMRRNGQAWEVVGSLKSMVSFQRHNLLDGPVAGGPFDVVFCRNVLIYFDAAGKTRVLDQIRRAMAPDGALFLGSAETVIGLTTAFSLRPGSRGLYQPTSAIAPARASLRA
jgi:chemotaxis protein methyltransferase CheR